MICRLFPHLDRHTGRGRWAPETAVTRVPRERGQQKKSLHKDDLIRNLKSSWSWSPASLPGSRKHCMQVPNWDISL